MRLLLDVSVPEIGVPYVWQNLKDDYASVLYQFRLSTPLGEDWYDKGVKAYAGLDAGTVSDGMFYNWVFTGRAEDASGTTMKLKPMAMDAPRTATAKRNHDFSMNFYHIIIAVIVVVAALAASMMMRPRREPKPAMVSSATQAAAPHLSGTERSRANCHAFLPVKANACSSCGQTTWRR